MLRNYQCCNVLYGTLTFLSHPQREERYYTFILKWFWLQQWC